jgi:hypothetical protein
MAHFVRQSIQWFSTRKRMYHLNGYLICGARRLFQNSISTDFDYDADIIM